MGLCGSPRAGMEAFVGQNEQEMVEGALAVRSALVGFDEPVTPAGVTGAVLGAGAPSSGWRR